MMEQRRFRDIAGSFATGVTVVTTRTGDGSPIGMTVNSFTSLSLNPPLVLVTIAKQASLFSEFMNTDCFAVNVLSGEQEQVSRTFAAKDIDRFAHVTYYAADTGAPIIDGALSFFDCQVSNHVEAGDHVILIGEVKSGDMRDGEPLLFYRGKYRVMSESVSHA